MKNICRLGILVALLSVLPGCGPRRPGDMPKLYPCTVTLMQEGIPLKHATVILLPEDPEIKWGIAGNTNENGKATLLTSGDFKGVPMGTYKLTVSKTMYLGDEPEPEDPSMYDAWQQRMMNNEFSVPYYLVDPKYSAPATTPLSLTVPKGGLEETIDLGKSIKVKMR